MSSEGSRDDEVSAEHSHSVEYPENFEQRAEFLVVDVYDGRRTHYINIQLDKTVLDLKKKIQKRDRFRSLPDTQRLIFRGRLCEDSQVLSQLVCGDNVLEQLDLRSQSFKMDLYIQLRRTTSTAPAPVPADLAQPPAVGTGNARAMWSAGSVGMPSSNTSMGSSTGSDTTGSYSDGSSLPERIHLSKEQLAHVKWQFQQALRERQERAKAEQEQQCSWKSMARAQQQSFGAISSGVPSYAQIRNDAWHAVTFTSGSNATRALGGNMPGPSAGGSVRDITEGSPGDIQPIGEADDRWPRGNVVDPLPHQPPGPPVNRLKLLGQILVVLVIFGRDVEGLQLLALVLAVVAAFLYRSGLLEHMLGASAWEVLGKAAGVVKQEGGVLSDVRYLLTTFVFSVFPQWKLVPDPEAVDADIARRAAARQDVQEGRPANEDALVEAVGAH